MTKVIIIISLIISCGQASVWSQTPTVIKMEQLDKLLKAPNDTTYVVNFWATWCTPCVKEFPAFQSFAHKHLNEKVKVVMVSLDFKKDYQKSLVPFLKQHNIEATVYLLDEPDYNAWINKIDKDWQGDIPCTLMFNNGKKLRKFFANDFTSESLENSFSQTFK